MSPFGAPMNEGIGASLDGQSSVNVPLVALYGPTSPEFTPPLSNKVKVIKKNEGFSKLRNRDLEDGYYQGLKDIKPKEVLEALFEFES